MDRRVAALNSGPSADRIGAKPQGLAVDDLAALAEKLASGGLDFIKDDHGLADQRYSHFAERVTACSAGGARGVRSTGTRPGRPA